MSDSRVRARSAARVRAAALALAAVACAGALSPAPGGGAWAQDPAQVQAPAQAPTPTRLVPQDILQPLTAPQAAAPAQSGTDGTLDAGPVGLRGTPAGRPETQAGLTSPGLSAPLQNRQVREIEINPLARIAPEAIGTLGAETGGFGIDMWHGTSRKVIEGLLPRLPARMASRAMRDLARRLLLSVAPPPAFESRAVASAAPGAQGLSASDLAGQEAAMSAGLLVLRAQRLAEMGEIPALVGLLSVVPAHVEQEPLERLHVEALFLSHQRDEACRRARNGIAVYHQQAFWQKAMVFCHMAEGDLDRGMLGLDLLREQGIADDPMFFALAERSIGVSQDLPAVETLSPLHVAMLSAAGTPFPPLAPDRTPPALLYAIATAPGVTPAERAEAAERACAAGIVDGTALAQGYDAVAFAPDQLGNAIGAAAAMEGTEARALLYQAARQETLPATRAEVLRVALEEAADAGLFPAAVAVYGNLIAEIEPSPQMTWFAAAAGRVLHGAGQHPQAGAWLALARQESVINPQASAVVADLWPYARLAGNESSAAGGNLAAWGAMREAAGNAPPAGTTALLRAAFEALGQLDPLTWSDIAAQSKTRKAAEGATEDQATVRPLPDAAFFHALADASAARRVGETVALSLIVLGEAGPGGSHDLALGTVLAALTRAGLERDARALAIEAALARGI